jgi:hypothetical protein
MGLRKSDQCDRQREDEARKRSADGNIEQALAIRDTCPLDDDRSHRSPGYDWKRYEKRIRGRHLVATGLQIMPHFMGDENCHYGAKKNRPIFQHPGQ